MGTALVKYEAARLALRQARRVDEAKDIRDKAIAFAAYARQAKDREMAQWVSEIRVWAERRAGELLRESDERRERSAGGRPKKTNHHNRISLPTLKEIGVSANQSANWQKIATIPEERFEQVLATAKKPVTTNILLAEVKAQKRDKVVRKLVRKEHKKEQEPKITADPEIALKKWSAVETLADGDMKAQHLAHLMIGMPGGIRSEHIELLGAAIEWLIVLRNKIEPLVQSCTTPNKERAEK